MAGDLAGMEAAGQWFAPRDVPGGMPEPALLPVPVITPFVAAPDHGRVVTGRSWCLSCV